MYGQPPHFRPGGGGRETAQSPQQQQVHLNPNLFPNPNCFLPQQIPNFLPQLNPFFQNPNSFPQIHQEFLNTNYPVQLNADYNNFQPPRPNGNANSTFPQQHGTVQKDQNPISFPQIHQPFPNNNYPVQLNADYNSFQPQRPNGNNNSTLPEQHGKVQKEMVEKLDKAAVKARKDLMKSNDNVSAWKVSQAALLAVKAESWESLGFQIQQVPSLNSLLVTEGEINAFIHCFVAVRRITSLYDLEVAICESEGVKQFEELELGPLVRHPLVVHYFSVSSNLSEVYRIRTEEIIDYLYEFTCAHKKKEIKVDSFLDFISEKQSVSSREVLCVRVQNLGLYLNLIKQARQSDDNVLEKCYDKMRTTIGKRRKKRPLFSAQKKEMDEKFVSISQRMKSFSSVSTQFRGKHIRFMSSSSEDEDSEASDYEDNQDQKNTDSKCSLSLPNGRAQRVGSCPYPSADEEMRRLGLKSDLESMSCTPDGNARRSIDNELSRKKRRYENISSSAPLPRKVPKKDKFAADLKHKGSGNEDMGGHSLSIESLKMFVTTWKDACRRSNADEVLDMMLQFYNSRRKKKVKEMFGSYPFVGLLYAAVTCIKLGLWDNMYDTLQTFGQACVDDKTIESSADYISIDVESAKKDVQGREPLTHKQDVMSEDIVLKIAGYFEDDVLTCKSPSRENRIHFLRKLCKCEYWLIQQFSVDKFESLGYGEYFLFLEKYMERIPPLQKYIIGDISENVSLEAHLLPIQLDVLLSQAATGLCESETINMRNISELLARQFPLVCFKLVSSDPMANFPDVLRERRFNLESNSVLFSTPLARLTYMGDSLSQNEKKVEEPSECANNRLTREGSIAPVTTRDAINVLLLAPMLTDLNLWSHWDILYAPSLGSIVGWLLKEVNTKELLCLVTKDGKVIRVDPLAATDSFLKVLIQESSFETAVQLLSLFVLYGGDRSVPLSLLKCHARQAFEVILNNYSELNLHSDGNPIMCGKISGDQHIVGKITSRNLHSKLLNDKSVLNKAARFILDCLSYLPIEFCSFAADVLIAGLQSFVNNVPAAMLAECKRTDQRLMLHEVGLSLGVYEWVNDYQSFCASAPTRSSSELSCLDVVNSELNASPIVEQGELVMHTTSSGEMLVSSEVDHHGQDKSVSARANPVKVSVSSPTAYPKQLSVLDNHIDNDPARIIESIRQEEFGLDQSLSATENSMLEKQHARLGRALHCLSQELYSQDSHFILELVQNADDNIYLGNVEPTLTFILQERGIIVLNNEQGFSSSNIRALCDVGNSTKKGLNAGYIGKKGIGFKSVFRVTDAPEIHSNGFHIKFDITEGQIGFVLPTVVSPCDIDMYARLAANGDQLDENSWKTCIVLPFRSNLLEGYAMNNILSMFSDLHPSLLLFLHRLQCIKFRSLLDDSLVVMRKKVVGDGIVEVAHGNQKMTWFVASKKLKADIIRSDVETTEISLAFTLEETGEEGYASILNQQPVFSFLPLRTYGLKFILQGDFVLPSSREEVDGNNPWNQWLLSEFPDLFVSAERSFCALPCYKSSPGKAITVFMSFVPLVSEVHGFFSSLPRRIISKLRMSNCLILDGDEKQWVPPCKVLRNWTDQARSLLPDVLLREHLGLGFLDKDIVLSDSLAKALGVEDYGSTTLFRVMSSLCRSDGGLKSMGLGWLASWLNTVCVMSSQLSIQSFTSSLTESDFILNLQRTPFIPLSDGKYSCVAEGTIWLASETVDQGINDECLLKAFPKLYAKLRIVSPGLLAAAASIGSSCPDIMILQNVARVLYKVGVQKLSIHDIVKLQIFPAISDIKNAVGQEELMIEYLAFAMFHLQSSCTTCSLEKGRIIAELHDKALILTNFGFKRLNEVPIHFSKEYGNPVDVDKLVSGLDMRWHEIDAAYMRHPITKSMSGGMLKWRNFFQEIGVTDFVQVVEVNKIVPEMSLVTPKDLLQAKGMTSTDSVKNWESQELLHLLSSLSSREDREKSKYLLEILDSLWDDYFSNKVSGSYIDVAGERKPCKSSLIRIFEDFPWVASNINTELHYPKDLFHDCVAVNSIFGVSAPYTIPKVRSEKLLADIGLKTQVTLDDALSVLRIWRKSEFHFNASVSQMSNFYSFLWKGLTHSKKKVIEELLSGPFIFVPKTSIYSEEDALYGSLLSPQEVYWHDSIGSMDQIKPGHLEGVSKIPCSPQRKMLRNFYPNLHDFFVNECGVVESPPLSSYLQILLQLSATALPHQAAKRVFDVFLIWDAALKIGSMSVEDVEYLKESLLKKEYTVLPTRQDKWVSLHSSFGLICWCDDDNLGREFKHLEGVDFLFFGESTDEDNQMLAARVSVIMQRLGVPSLSEVVTREVISYGPADSNFFFSLVNWVLPYAQRYIHDAQPDKYFQLKQTGFENLINLKIVVVEKLFYRNKIKKCEITSKKRHQCNCLLQENILYCLRESDPHSIFLELSRLLFNGTPELHFANFLHMITIMAKSGATEEQTELFILNSQRVPKLPSDEPTWSLQPPSSFMDYNATLPENCHILRVEELNSLLVKRKPVIKSNWPPADWKTAPGFNPLCSSGFGTPGSSTLRIVEGNNAEKVLEQIDISPDYNSNEFNNEADTTAITQGAVLVEPEILESHSSLSSNLMTSSSMNIVLDSVDLVSPDIKNVGPSGSTERDQVSAQQALLTGRLGELVAFKFFVGKVGEQFVKWVNETNETGLPYDIVVEGDETSKEYIEVKATKYGRKNWFLISMREWQFAVEKGESFSIAHVVLADDNMARVTVYKNPARLCQTGNLKLAFVVPKQ